MEKEISARRLKNMVIRYKFRANAYSFDKEAKQTMRVHLRSELMHHKGVFVNGRYLVTGSYNWSESASDRNLENVMLFDKHFAAHKDVVERFQAEFDFIWNSSMTTSGPKGKSQAERICKLLTDKSPYFIRNYIENNPDCTLQDLIEDQTKARHEIIRELGRMQAAGLITVKRENGKTTYSLKD